MNANHAQPTTIRPWNKGKFIGQKAPLKLKEIWAIRIWLQLEKCTRDLALFNLAIDSKLRSCDLLSIRVSEITQGSRVLPRAIVMQQKTQRPVQFEITEQTRSSVLAWIQCAQLASNDFLFPSLIQHLLICRHASMRASLMPGLYRSGWNRQGMVPTRCGESKPR